MSSIPNILECGHPKECLSVGGVCRWCREVKILKAVETQLLQRLDALIEASCPECRRLEKKALRKIGKER